MAWSRVCCSILRFDAASVREVTASSASGVPGRRSDPGRPRRIRHRQNPGLGGGVFPWTTLIQGGNGRDGRRSECTESMLGSSSPLGYGCPARKNFGQCLDNLACRRAAGGDPNGSTASEHACQARVPIRGVGHSWDPLLGRLGAT